MKVEEIVDTYVSIEIHFSIFRIIVSNVIYLVGKYYTSMIANIAKRLRIVISMIFF